MEDGRLSSQTRPTSSFNRHRRTSSSHSQPKPWESRSARYRSSTSRSRPEPEEVEPISRQNTHTSSRSKRREPKWWKVRLFKGMVEDVKRRAPYYLSDWTDAWTYRSCPAVVYMYFAKYVVNRRNRLAHTVRVSAKAGEVSFCATLLE
jgi:boron transporter